MKVTYLELMPADCTSDPHPVSYGERSLKVRVKTMLADIVRVCQSDMVGFVRVVRCDIGDTRYESDYYDITPLKKTAKRLTTPESRRHKIYGGYFWCDPDDEQALHIPPGLSGLRAVIPLILTQPKQFKMLSVGVIWSFAGEGSCADYISIDDMSTVNYGSQDWWTQNENYGAWCDQMEAFLNRRFPRAALKG